MQVRTKTHEMSCNLQYRWTFNYPLGGENLSKLTMHSSNSSNRRSKRIWFWPFLEFSIRKFETLIPSSVNTHSLTHYSLLHEIELLCIFIWNRDSAPSNCERPSLISYNMVRECDNCNLAANANPVYNKGLMGVLDEGHVMCTCNTVVGNSPARLWSCVKGILWMVLVVIEDIG